MVNLDALEFVFKLLMTLIFAVFLITAWKITGLQMRVETLESKIETLEKEREADKERITRLANAILGARIQMSDRQYEKLKDLRNENRQWRENIGDM